MKLSATQAAKRTGKSVPTITRAIKNGTLSANKLGSGGYEIDPSELFRVFPAASDDSDVTLTKLESETPALEREITLLREMLTETRTDRDRWRDQAEKVTKLLEDRRPKAQAGRFSRAWSALWERN